MLPVHSLDAHSLHVNILPLDHTNPYDFKREHRHSYFEIMFIENGGGNQLIDFVNYPVKENSCYIICPQQVHLMNRKNSSGTLLQFTEERSSTPALAIEEDKKVLLDFYQILDLRFSENLGVKDYASLLFIIPNTLYSTTFYF